MFLLPKGNPLHENIPAARVKLPELLEKLKNGGFTGYLRFSFPEADGVLFFEAGKLVSAMLEKGSVKSAGFEAIAGISNMMLAGGGTLSVYRLSKDLTMCLHALLHGEMLYKGQELKLIDVKGLLDKMKAQQLNGCLRIYTEDRLALIFYKSGSPLGFFHDGSQEIETSASESQKIAGLPGAKIDVLSTASADDLMTYDLLEMVNIDKLWESSLARHASSMEQLKKEAEAQGNKEKSARLLELEEDLKELAIAYLGKVGRTLIEKELTERGGSRCLVDEGEVTRLLAGIEKSAKLLTSVSKVREMLEVMKGEIQTRADSDVVSI